MQRHMGEYLVHFESWHTGIKMVAKAIWHYIMNLSARLVIAIKPYRSEHREGAQIVDASNVVVVDMGHQNGVERLEWQRHELLTYIGSAIYEHTCSG